MNSAITSILLCLSHQTHCMSLLTKTQVLFIVHKGNLQYVARLHSVGTALNHTCSVYWHVCDYVRWLLYHIAEHFQEKKLSRIGKKWLFRGENFHGILNPIIGRYGTPKFPGENFHGYMALKLRNLWMFSPSKFFRYTISNQLANDY